MIIKAGADSKYLVYAMHLLTFGTMLSFLKFFKLLGGEYSGKKERTKTYMFEIFSKGLLGVMSIGLGVFGRPIMVQFFNVGYAASDYHILEKTFEYVFYFGLAFIVYHFALRHSQWLKKLERFDVSFNSAVLTLVLYFIALLSYMSFA